MHWDLATNIILAASFAVLAVFAFLALFQWIKNKSLKKVDRPLLLMLVPLILMVITYFIFDKLFVLNTRPNGSGEPSFPSTHVMVVATIFSLTAIILPYYIKSKTARTLLDLLMIILVILVSVGRIFANKHWTSDVIGALIFAAIFALVYYLTIRRIKHE